MRAERFSTAEACRLSGLSPQAVRSLVKAGVVGQCSPAGRQKGRFAFRDLTVLRMARSLLDQGLSPARLCRTLVSVQRQTARHEVPLSGARLLHQGDRVVASDGTGQWEAESGRLVPEHFAKKVPSAVIEPLLPTFTPAAARTSPAAPAEALPDHAALGQADQWFNLALELEENDPRRSYAYYMRALACDPEHVEAVINVGRLCSADRDPARAAAFFRLAVRLDPAHPVAHFNLAVIEHDAGRWPEAMRGYRQALRLDPLFADAHFNLGTLLERLGRTDEAAQHFVLYRQAMQQPR